MSVVAKADLSTLELPVPRHVAASGAVTSGIETAGAGTPAALQRLASLDAFRGLVMVLMVSAGLRIGDVVRNFERTPELQHLKTPLWERLAYQTDHAPWVGCSLWDLIQPSFMFMVGTALAFSVASRRAKGQTFTRMLGHAVLRAALLSYLGIFLISNWSKSPDWSFVVVLTQIGLGYVFLFLLAWVRPRWQFASAMGILVLYWGAFALYPKPAPHVDLASVNLPSDWKRLEGFASHWEKNQNMAAALDRWFLNLFPRNDGKPFTFNSGGYQTLNFVPSLATMIFGLLAGELIRGRLSAAAKFWILLGCGLAGLGVGWVLDRAGICPIVKRIWTPSWTIFSAGWAFLLLAIFYLIVDIGRIRFWAWPLLVVGMNSIAAYCMSMILRPWVRDNINRHFGHGVYEIFGKAYAPMVDATLFLIFCWLVCWWMYRQKMFIRI